MDLDARVDVNCEWKDRGTHGQKAGCLYHTFFKAGETKTCYMYMYFTLKLSHNFIIYLSCEKSQ